MLVGKPKITGQKYVWFVWAYQCFLCTDTVLYDTTTARSVSQTDLQLSVLRLYERWSPRGVKKMLFRLRLANKSHAPNLFSLLLISRDPFTASRDLCQWSLEAINTDPGHRLILWWDPSPPPLPRPPLPSPLHSALYVDGFYGSMTTPKHTSLKEFVIVNCTRQYASDAWHAQKLHILSVHVQIISMSIGAVPVIRSSYQSITWNRCDSSSHHSSGYYYLTIFHWYISRLLLYGIIIFCLSTSRLFLLTTAFHIMWNSHKLINWKDVTKSLHLYGKYDFKLILIILIEHF